MDITVAGPVAGPDPPAGVTIRGTNATVANSTIRGTVDNFLGINVENEGGSFFSPVLSNNMITSTGNMTFGVNVVNNAMNTQGVVRIDGQMIDLMNPAVGTGIRVNAASSSIVLQNSVNNTVINAPTTSDFTSAQPIFNQILVNGVPLP